MGQEFSPEQKRWLEGFASGASAVRTLAKTGQQQAPAPAAVTGPDAPLLTAQRRTVAAGGKLVDQEKWKAAEHPLDAYARLKTEAESGARPRPEDNFRWRYHGLFYVAPAQDSFMCRLRIPNGILKAAQLARVADIAETLAGGYAHVTTRANLQLREIEPANAAEVVEQLADIGIITRGAGADNIRNVTGSATAGIDPVELIDTRPHARAWHHHVLNTRALYGLPRKFNVAFDGGGAIATLEDTNDIGFQAVEVRVGDAPDPSVWYRLMLGGVTGHKDFARQTGVIVKPDDAVRVADAVVRVFIANGDRTNRAKARLKYLIDAWGLDAFLAETEKVLGAPLARVDAAHAVPRPEPDRHGHIGVHRQKQPGLNYVGIVLPVGRLSASQVRAVAALSAELGDGEVRLTVWQNLLVSGVSDDKIDAAKARIEAAGLTWKATAIGAGLVACTGNTGCKFSASDTKGHALAIMRQLEGLLPPLDLDRPVNIHLTGCPNSCAQHMIADIGLVGAKVAVGSEGDQVEGYHVYVGGGFAGEATIARLLYSDVRAEETLAVIERLLRAYLHHRIESEGFAGFAHRHEIEALRALAGAAAEVAA